MDTISRPLSFGESLIVLSIKRCYGLRAKNENEGFPVQGLTYSAQVPKHVGNETINGAPALKPFSLISTYIMGIHGQVGQCTRQKVFVRSVEGYIKAPIQ